MVRQHWCEPLPMAIIRWWNFFWELGPNLTYRIRWEQSRNCLTSGVYPLHLFSFTYFVLNLVHTLNYIPYCYCWALYKTCSNTMLVSVVIIPLSLSLAPPLWAGNDAWLQYMYVFFNFIQYLILYLFWSLSRYTSSYLHSVSILKLNWWTFYTSYQFILLQTHRRSFSHSMMLVRRDIMRLWRCFFRLELQWTCRARWRIVIIIQLCSPVTCSVPLAVFIVH